MSYTKSASTTVPWTRDQQFIRKNGSVIQSLSSGRVTLARAATYGENPRWRDHVKRNILATTQLDGTKEVLTGSVNGSMRWDRDPSTATATNTVTVLIDGLVDTNLVVPPTAPSGIHLTSADNQAKTRFVNRLQDQISAFQGGVALGEISQTIHMLRNPAKALREGISSYYSTAKKRASREKTTKRKNKAVASTWLEAQYGWLPLISDVKNADKAMRRLAENPNVAVRVIGYGEGFDSATLVSGTQSAGQGEWKSHVHVSQWTKVIYIGATKSSPVWAGHMKARLFGFSWSNFVPTIWELIPYSFLVDYFTNIGDVINGWSNQRAGLAWSQRTRINGSTRSGTLVGQRSTSSPFFEYSGGSPPSVVRETTSISRAGYFGTFTPTVMFEIPGIGSRKWLNIAALARMRI